MSKNGSWSLFYGGYYSVLHRHQRIAAISMTFCPQHSAMTVKTVHLTNYTHVSIILHDFNKDGQLIYLHIYIEHARVYACVFGCIYWFLGHN